MPPDITAVVAAATAVVVATAAVVVDAIEGLMKANDVVVVVEGDNVVVAANVDDNGLLSED